MQALGPYPGQLHHKLWAWIPSQDGGIGRYTLPRLTTKGRTMTYLKTKQKNNQKRQKIKLYVSQITKELKKQLSYRLVAGVEMASWGGEDAWQGTS